MTNAQLLAILRHVQIAGAECREDVAKIAAITDKRLESVTKPARKLHNALVELDSLIQDLQRKQDEPGFRLDLE